MKTYVLNIITDKKMDGEGNILRNGRVLNKYPLCAKWSGELKDYKKFTNAIYQEYLEGLDEDTLGRTYLYLRIFDGANWITEKICTLEFFNKTE